MLLRKYEWELETGDYMFALMENGGPLASTAVHVTMTCVGRVVLARVLFFLGSSFFVSTPVCATQFQASERPAAVMQKSSRNYGNSRRNLWQLRKTHRERQSWLFVNPFGTVIRVEEGGGISYKFASPPNVQGWLRFEEYYAPRVRVLRLKHDPAFSAVMDVLYRIRRSSKPLLPNLQSLHWTGLAGTGLAEPLFTFVPDTLQVFTLKETAEYSEAALTVLEAIVSRMTQLTNLILTLPADQRYATQVEQVICGLPSLKSATIPAFEDASALLSRLAALKGLRHLWVVSKQGPGITQYEFAGGRSPLAINNGQPSTEYFPSLESLTILCSYWTASNFLCHQIPQLASLHLITQKQETPAHAQSLLSNISKTCPCIKQLSLTVKGEMPLEVPSPAEHLLTVETLRPILACPSITSFEIIHPLPLSLGLDELVEIASAWPRLQRLDLNSAPLTSRQPTPKDLSLHALLPFARYCSDIETLGLFINAKSYSIPSDAEIEPLPSPFTKLQTISVGISSIAREGEIAEFLSLICPPGCIIQYGPVWYPFKTGDAGAKWKEVNKLLVHLFAVRARYERKTTALKKKLDEMGIAQEAVKTILQVHRNQRSEERIVVQE
ncbi:hypothetical protein D9758_018927 [Tetrapyrgos nigripes]|uniref:Uncharacterized protein n=1 Tax=Tetrapyrgos nigripes TaxID=182062 RepID=A0A8H5AV99_9AGAR|nr:hypothetical protein D9758_018927 [Tetrapyrgos nigripes]